MNARTSVTPSEMDSATRLLICVPFTLGLAFFAACDPGITVEQRAVVCATDLTGAPIAGAELYRFGSEVSAPVFDEPAIALFEDSEQGGYAPPLTRLPDGCAELSFVAGYLCTDQESGLGPPCAERLQQDVVLGELLAIGLHKGQQAEIIQLRILEGETSVGREIVLTVDEVFPPSEYAAGE